MTDVLRKFATYPITFIRTAEVLNELGDVDTYYDAFEMVQFGNNADAIHFRLRFPQIERCSEKVWTVPPESDARNWLTEHSADAEVQEWVLLFFATLADRTRFENAIWHELQALVRAFRAANPEIYYVKTPHLPEAETGHRLQFSAPQTSFDRSMPEFSGLVRHERRFHNNRRFRNIKHL